MLDIEINRDSIIPLHQQIFENISDRIRSGVLSDEEQLPSMRVLSRKLGVSLLTVVKVYDNLEKNQLIIRIQGKGSFVHLKTTAMIKVSNQEEKYRWQSSFSDYVPRNHFNHHFNTHETSYQLAVAAISPGLLPNRYIQSEIAKILEENPLILSEYGPIQGDEELRYRMSKYLEKQNIFVSQNDILVTNGAQQGIDLVARTFIGPGDVVVVEAPTYSAAIDTFRNRGATIIGVPVDDEGMRMDILQKVIEKYKPKLVYTIPNFHNPTGQVLSEKRRRKLLLFAEEYQFLIVEDDPWSEIFFEKAPPSPIKSYDDKGHVIYIKGLSKVLAPGCRIGVLMANGLFLERLLVSKANVDLGSSMLTQKAILPLLESERIEKHMEKLRFALKLRRDKVISILNENLPDGVRWTVPKGGISVWITFPETCNTTDLLVECKKRNVLFLPGSSCFSGELEKNHLRISFSFLSEELLEEGLLMFCEMATLFINK